MRHWPFVLAAYGLAAAVLVGYWARVEHRIRILEAQLEEQETRP
jgi:hypothetical protein